jgi:transposase-like protein
MAKRRNFTDQFKAKVALEALRDDKTIQEIASKPSYCQIWCPRIYHAAA